MILADTSALIAIIQNEPEAENFGACVTAASAVAVPASCYLEACMVLRRRPGGRADLDRLLALASMTFIPLDEAISRLDGARRAVRTGALDAADATDGYVRHHPWQAIGTAALAGLAVGFLLRRP